MSASAPRRTALYRCFAADGALLYVGAAYNPDVRFKVHASISPWWSLVERTTVEWLPSRPEAEDAELAAIGAEQPRYNRAGSDSPMNVTRDFAIDGEISTARARNRLADVINEAVRERITVITHHGRPVAAVVSRRHPAAHPAVTP